MHGKNLAQKSKKTPWKIDRGCIFWPFFRQRFWPTQGKKLKKDRKNNKSLKTSKIGKKWPHVRSMYLHERYREQILEKVQKKVNRFTWSSPCIYMKVARDSDGGFKTRNAPQFESGIFSKKPLEPCIAIIDPKNQKNAVETHGYMPFSAHFFGSILTKTREKIEKIAKKVLFVKNSKNRSKMGPM